MNDGRPPRSAYVHVPFCASRCGYCSFTLVAGRDDLMERYLQAIELELHQFRQPHEVDTIFLGGGTPTQLGPRRLERLLLLVRQVWPLSSGGELSVEANPADIDADLLSAMANSGVTRVSLGGQSFDAVKLRTLERDHTPDGLHRALALCRAQMASLSLDLIFGVPGESLAVWQHDLSQALSHGVDHMSTYGLTFERGAAFWGRLSKGELARPDEELERSMYLLAIDQLAQAGVEHYEISNFARSGHRCRHNEVYWAGESFDAVGPGAARYIDGQREMNHRSTTTYLKRMLAGGSPVAETEVLAPEDRARERLVFGLRRLQGVDRSWFVGQTGFEVDALIRQPLERFVSLGMLTDDGQAIRLTRAGLPVSDAIWPYFLQPA